MTFNALFNINDIDWSDRSKHDNLKHEQHQHCIFINSMIQSFWRALPDRSVCVGGGEVRQFVSIYKTVASS